MRAIICGMLMLIGLPGLILAAGLPDGQALDLYLLVGQSNMSGRGKIEPSDQIADPYIWKLDKTLNWVPATDPLHFDKPSMVGVGPGLSFAKAILSSAPTRPIGLIPAAVGGTSIEEWAKGGKLYDDAIRRCKAAQNHGTLRAILWHQGEADCAPAKEQAYTKNLQTLVANFRTDLDAPDAPFIAGQLGSFYKSGATFNQMISTEVPMAIPNSACASSDGLTDRGDRTHFDTASQRELGKRYAAALLKLSAPTTQASGNQTMSTPAGGDSRKIAANSSEKN